MSVSSTPIGSVATSAVPIRLQTCSTSSGKRRQNHLFHFGVVADRLFQVGSRQSHDADRNGPFGEPRHELRTKIRSDHAKRQDQHLAAKPITASLWCMANCRIG